MFTDTLPTRKSVANALQTVLDPELGVSIVDLGLIYNIVVSDKNVTVTMTLTSIGCPLFPTIEREMQEKIKEVDGVETISVQVVFDPAWNIAMISPNARMELGLE